MTLSGFEHRPRSAKTLHELQVLILAATVLDRENTEIADSNPGRGVLSLLSKNESRLISMYLCVSLTNNF
jgi:hypothetical protein